MHMRLLIGMVVLGGGLVCLHPVESWAWSSDRYRMEGSLSHTSILGILPVTVSAPSAVLPTMVIGLPAAPLHYRLSPESGQPTEETPPAAFLEESLDNDIEIISLDAPIVRTPKVERHVQFFSFHIRDRFEQWLNRLERHRPMVQSIFTEFNLPLDLIFLSLVESGFNTNAVSRAKAVGPWQFIKPTAKTYGLRVDNWIDERRDPVKSTVAAAHYLRDLYHLFGSWPLAMAAYNAGENKVGRALTRTQGADFWDLTDTKLLKRETKEYVPRFLAATMIAKDPDRFGLTVTPQDPVEYEEVVLTRPLHLRVAARAAGVSYAELKSLNPELRRDVTPPDPVYHLKVPVGSKSALIDNLSIYAQEKKIQTVRYQIRRGDTLPLVASRHGLTIQAIQQANDLEKSYKPKIGDWLLLPKPVRTLTVPSQ